MNTLLGTMIAIILLPITLIALATAILFVIAMFSKKEKKDE